MKINIKNIKVKSVCATLFISLFLSCNNGIEELEKKNTFFDSLVNIGHSFQEIFGSFGNAMGDALGFSAVKSDSKKSEVGEHFEKIGKGLQSTKDKLDGLLKEVVSTTHADTKAVEAVIKSSSEVISKLIDSITKLAGVTKEAGEIGDAEISTKAAGADKESVDSILKEVKAIIGVANEVTKNLGVNIIQKGNDGDKVANGDDKAGAALVGKNSGGAKPDAAVGPLLSAEVAKADPWAIIAKIEKAKTGDALVASDNNASGALATNIPTSGNQNGALTNADLVAAVALKAMTKAGKFAAKDNDDAKAVKAAAATAVNKVLGILDVIIRKTIGSNLEKVRKAIKGIQYSETTDQATEAGLANK
ncbi:variable large family protein [Borrelia coriaceae]|uniref:Variable large protein n=1 Tax=Borrelia coriaceae ATCC 43381 TaxID=1408429 RepID=W5SXP1_9SPIR|nr:variable large family protein [Borrelia coriaceae]AHH11657.1 Variable major protein [Borrelia coriaceae ATCC 43381]